MTRTKVDGSIERKLITSLIMDDKFLKQIAPIIKPTLLKTSYAKEVATWVLEYYASYNEAPKKQIQDIYLEKRSSVSYDEDTAESIATFLQSLSTEYTGSNLDYSVDQAESYLKIRSLELFKEDMEKAIATNDPVKGEALIANFSRVGKQEGEGISISFDNNAIYGAYTNEDEALFTYPAALGEVCGSPIRGDLSAVLAPVKRGKSFFLWQAAEFAMMAGCKVAFFSLEMTKAQVIRRAWNSLTASTKKEMELDIPYFDLKDEDEDGKYEICYKTVNRFPVPLDSIETLQRKLRTKFRGGDCRLFAIPGYSSTVEDIISHLDNMMYYDNFIPDVVIIDYADILRASNGAGKEYRHQLNDIWLKLRWLARSRNIHVISASQTNRGGFAKDLSNEDIAEDMRKLAHVSNMVGLNQTRKEKENGIIRVVDLLQREEQSCFQQAVVLQNLKMGRFYLDSKLDNEVIYDKGETEHKKRSRE
jgi:hypothetical protein